MLHVIVYICIALGVSAKSEHNLTGNEGLIAARIYIWRETQALPNHRTSNRNKTVLTNTITAATAKDDNNTTNGNIKIILMMMVMTVLKK